MKTESVLHDIAVLRSSASDACALLKILANEDRLLILCELSQGTRNVGEYIYYSLASPQAIKIMETLFKIYCAERVF